MPPRSAPALPLSILLASCGASGLSPLGETAPGQEFIARQGDFQPFQSWTTFDVGDVTGDDTTLSGDRRLYVSQLPPHGSKTFPVGTIIVKTVNGWNNADAGQTFAMVKRGGDFNASGAIGWEWFELIPDGQGSPMIKWRGTQPAAGDSYGGSTVSCNACHMASASNDYVPSPQLQLSSY